MKALRVSGSRVRAGVLGVLLLLVMAFLLCSPLAGQEHSFTASLMGTVGGPLAADEPDPGLGSGGVLVGFSWVVQPQTNVVTRLGQMDFSGKQLENLFDPKLTYAVIGGEYTYQESYYKSGVFLGLGLYQLDGLTAAGASTDNTSVGLALGVTGDFPITSRFSIVAELSAHYADLNVTQLFGFFNAGVAFHF